MNLQFSRWRSVAVLGSIFAIAATAQDTTLKVDVKVVNVLTTVRDKKGEIVNTLTKDDFSIAEDGRPQTIHYFTRETDLPLTVGLLVDTSASQLEVLEQERTASAGFTNDVIRADKDSAFVMQFAIEVELLQDLTKSPLKIQESLEQVSAEPEPSGPPPSYPGGRMPGHHGGIGMGTALYDAVFLAADEVMQPQTGRKAIIVLTDGVDHGSKVSLERAIESAQRSDTIVYSIYFTGREGGGFQIGIGGGGISIPGFSSEGKKVLERLSKETGGRMFVVSKNESITEIYSEIQDELRNQYNLGYSPDLSIEGTDYRHIKVSTKEKDLIIHAREGYYKSQLDGPKQSQ